MPACIFTEGRMLTLELLLLFLLTHFRMISLSWNTRRFGHTIATLNAMSLFGTASTSRDWTRLQNGRWMQNYSKVLRLSVVQRDIYRHAVRNFIAMKMRETLHSNVHETLSLMNGQVLFRLLVFCEARLLPRGPNCRKRLMRMHKRFAWVQRGFSFQTFSWAHFLQNIRSVCYLFEFFQIVFGKNLVG